MSLNNLCDECIHLISADEGVLTCNKELHEDYKLIFNCEGFNIGD